MKLFTKALAVPALVGMLGLSTASQAMVVSEGFELGAGNFDSGEITLAAGDYTLDLEAFTFGPAGPFIFGIANDTEAFQVSVAEFGLASTFFSTVGGVFSFLVGGNAGTGTIYEASINAVPLPPSILMLGTAAAAMFSFGRRHSKSAKKA
jgi:hypothetical protein